MKSVGNILEYQEVLYLDIKSPYVCKQLGLHSVPQLGSCEMFIRRDLFKQYWIIWREPIKVIISPPLIL